MSANLLAKAYQSTDLLSQISCYRYTYDNMGRLLTITAPNGTLLQKNSYHANGLLKSKIDGAGSGIHFTYDLAGRKIQAQTETGAYQKYTYNPWGIITGIEDGNGNQTTYETDIWGRITQIHKADGSKEHYEYDNAGNITAVIDGNGNRREYRYNWRNQPEIIIDSLGERDIFTYDEEGNLHSHTDRNGISTLHEYNMYGDLTEKYVEGGTLRESYHYTAEGMLKYAIGGGMRYDYTYDSMGRLYEKKASGRTLLRYQYDLNGNIAQRTDFTGKTTTYQYNQLDQLTEVYDNGIRQALYEYGADGSLIRQTIGEDLITEYSYDADHNLTALKTTLAGMKKPYAENSSILPIASGITSPETALPQEKAFHPEAPQVLVDNHYTYDGNGNRLTKQTLNGINTYQFDALNRLVHVAYPTYSEEFRYDGAGNRIQRTVLPVEPTQAINGYPTKAREVNAMSADTLYNCSGTIRQQYSYDATNRLQSIFTEQNGTTHTEQFTYDKQGNLLQDGRQTYSYDAFNRTVRVETVEGNYQENRYDAEGLRAEMVENGELVKFLFAGREVVAETEADGNVIRYIRGYELISSDSEKAKTYYHYACDEQGSITHLVSGVEKVAETNIATDVPKASTIANMQGASISTHEQSISLEDRILNRYEYDAFGNTVYSEEKVHNRFRYTGQQYDPITQQYYLRARYYNPVIARFTQEDTYHGDGLNLYSYCHNNPLMYYDPSGHNSVICEQKYNDLRSKNPDELTADEQAMLDAYEKKYSKKNSSKTNKKSKDEGQPNNEEKDIYNSRKNNKASGEKAPEWKPGDPITKMTPDGEYPSWDTIRSRYWKNRAELDPGSFSPQNIGRMKKGLAPVVRVVVKDRKTGKIYEKIVSKEIHHSNGNRGIPGFDEPINLREVWPWEHENLLPPGRKLDYDFIGFR